MIHGCGSRSAALVGGATVADPQPTLGIIGGSGFYQIDGLEDVKSTQVDTPFGPTSGAIVVGRLGDVRCAFISRHGATHLLLPSEVPYRANIWALASLGVRSLVSVSAVGSLRPEVEPLHFVVPDQLIDRTTGARPSTFFGSGIVAHVALDEPYCPRLSRALAAAGSDAGATVHSGGSLVVIEGPAFSTRAESLLYQSWGATIIGMTAIPEAKLAREAGLCYACLACVTDYDTWHVSHGAVSVDMVLKNLMRNVDAARQTISLLTAQLPDPEECPCRASLATALVTRLDIVPAQRLAELAPLLRLYK
jgi:5'-methylthioadenosine phosphorylase